MAKHATRDDSSQLWFRSRVPAEALARLRGRLIVIELPAVDGIPARPVPVKVGDEIKFSLRTKDGDSATELRLHALAFLKRLYRSVLAGPSALNHKQLVALSGEIYGLVVQRYEDNPGPPEEWQAFKAFCRAAREGRIANPPTVAIEAIAEARQAAESFGGDLTSGINALPASDDPTGLEVRFGLLASFVLCRHGLEVDATTRIALLRQIANAAEDAGRRLLRAARGDYRPDPNAERFPAVEAPSKTRITFDDLFDRWKVETKPAPSTVTTWRGIVAGFVRHSGIDDPMKVKPDHVVSWKDALLEEGKTAKTVKDSHLACLSRLYTYGIANKLLTANPVEGIKVASRQRAGTRMLPYDDAELARLLQIASKETHPARRWLPLLAACTGARIGEIAQAWGQQVREIDGVWVLEIKPAPDGGTLKNEGSERAVPLHPVLIESGFLDFVRDRGNRPLFYGKRAKRGAEARHPSKGVSNHLASWIREQGFTDPRKAPSHAIRHWFKSSASRVGIADSVADAIQGHTDRSGAGTYRHFDLETLAEAVRRMPIPTSR